MTSSVWPYDTFVEPSPPESASIGALTCFIASPFEPQKRWDDLYNLILVVCKQIQKSLGVQIDCTRADQVAASGILHPEIWHALRFSDIVICDVSGQDSNVLLELGVAAAWRPKENVIILRMKSDQTPRLFDINPGRYLEYEISFSGLSKLTQELLRMIPKILASIPVQDATARPVNLPFAATLTDGNDNPSLHTQDITHRRMMADCLEFGSPFVRRYSWMSVGDLSVAEVHVMAEMKMTLDTPFPDRFMGIILRGQSFFANFGHFVLVNADGSVHLVARDDKGQSTDELLSTIPDFNMRDFAKFDVRIDNNAINGQVNGSHFSKRLAELPYVYSSGRVIFVAGHCRVGIRNIRVE
jgi:hypothetical protein